MSISKGSGSFSNSTGSTELFSNIPTIYPVCKLERPCFWHSQSTSYFATAIASINMCNKRDKQYYTTICLSPGMNNAKVINTYCASWVTFFQGAQYALFCHKPVEILPYSSSVAI